MLHMLDERQHKVKLEHLFSPANGIQKKATSRVMTCTMNALLWLWDSRVFANWILPACFQCQDAFSLQKKMFFFIKHSLILSIFMMMTVLLIFPFNRRFVWRKKLFEPSIHKKPIRGGGFNEVIFRTRLESLRNCLPGKKFLREGHVGFFLGRSTWEITN